MIAVSAAAVSALIVRRTTFGCTANRRLSRYTARTTRGSTYSPPLATELTAAAICSGVTPT